VQPVEILTIQESLILRAAGSELLILPNHVSELKKKQTPRDFTAYFMGETLVNRSARKLFEAWLRKDQGLWQRIYKTVQTVEVSEETLKAIKEADQPAKISPVAKSEVKAKKEEPVKAKAKEGKKEEKVEKKTKTAAKAEPKKSTAAKSSSKSSSSKTAKPAAKKKSK